MLEKKLRQHLPAAVLPFDLPTYLPTSITKNNRPGKFDRIRYLRYLGTLHTELELDLGLVSVPAVSTGYAANMGWV